MVSKLEKEIREEIEQYREKHGKYWGMEYFNNFDINLPGSLIRKPGFDLNSKPWKDDGEVSFKLREQSLEEFLETIDKVIENIKIEPQDIIEGRKYRFENDKFFDLITPIYIRLRELGYNHYPDLTV